MDRNYLTRTEVEKMIAACKGSRHKTRDRALILLSYIHGLRSREAVDMTWSQIDMDAAILHVKRVKRGKDTAHYLTGREIRMLRKLKSEQPTGAFVFRSQKGGPLTTRAVRDIVKKAGIAAKIDVDAHPHMLRHGAGFHLANAGKDTRSLQDYLGHRNIQHTVRYTQMSPTRFKDFWAE